MFRLWRQDEGQPRHLIDDSPPADGNSYEFLDQTAPAGRVEYWLQEMGSGGEGTWFGPATLAAAPFGTDPSLPDVLRLAPNRPNPFNPRTTFTYAIPSDGPVRLGIYDLRGRQVTVLVAADLPRGEYSVTWVGCAADGTEVSSGVYLARIETAAGVRSVKVALAR